ncbi:MAG: hypothetical protein FWC28_05085 [Proteobacteria bacterium]|nr:hypothetical protein [Cystobacterineae bacterium]MCL2259218.1 hypothetical protein [Cystobacterineae bacterium]MCL2314612.1 hypothetical protein [Pseudomonadota bacterium]
MPGQRFTQTRRFVKPMHPRPSPARLTTALLATLLAACQMPPLPSPGTPDEESLFLKNVHLYSAKDDELQLSGRFSEVRFLAKRRLLKSKHANILWLPEWLHFQAEHFNLRLDTQEAWALEGWKFQAKEGRFGEGSLAYGYKDKLGNMVAQTEEPLRLWTEGEERNILEAQAATCEKKTKRCEFLGTVNTTLGKAP